MSARRLTVPKALVGRGTFAAQVGRAPTEPPPPVVAAATEVPWEPDRPVDVDKLVDALRDATRALGIRRDLLPLSKLLCRALVTLHEVDYSPALVELLAPLVPLAQSLARAGALPSQLREPSTRFVLDEADLARVASRVTEGA